MPYVTLHKQQFKFKNPKQTISSRVFKTLRGSEWRGRHQGLLEARQLLANVDAGKQFSRRFRTNRMFFFKKKKSFCVFCCCCIVDCLYFNKTLISFLQ
jgi:hypothetical protein